MIFSLRNTAKVLAITICIITMSPQTQAQNSVSETIGNPDSSNFLMIQQTTGIINTPQVFSSSQQQTDSDWETLPQDPGVEVSPPPFQTPQEPPLPTLDENIEVNTTIIDD